ncbi:MAG TPA: aldehyde ferredoxin oxidoreductase family protein [Syntrophorhabdales bacterium]|nr:aldehyde ferredoxin oxidoreductase family protein [Syntrophorhabdales bacterium]
MATAVTARLLRVNLSRRTTAVETVPTATRELFVGGRGFGISYLYGEQPAEVDPLGEENRLIFLAGPLAGAQAQSVSRWMVVTKSPLTGAYARSVAGADFGAWLRFAGYEALLVEGKSETPVYLHLTKDGCAITDARDIWGTNTLQAQDVLHQRHGNRTRVACIGPAGERLVRYAAIASGRRTASRCGVGTVMGSKNLKAIAITADRMITLSDPDLFKELAKEQYRLYRESEKYVQHRQWGTTMTQDITNTLGVYPTRNFRYGQQKNAEKLYGEEYRKIRTGEFGCYNCSARCGKAHTVTTGEYAGAWSEGPEYESIWVFSAPIDSTSIEATIRADGLCDDLGMDTISAGNSIAFAYELYEHGIIDRKDTDGLELVYGNHQAMIKLIEKIAAREGFGDILAEGSVRAAAKIGRGAESYAIHAKGMELPAYEPRGAKSQGFNYATSNIGGSHCYGYAHQEIFGAPIPRVVNRFEEVQNADIVITNQNTTATNEVGINCSFARPWGWFPVIYAKLLAAATGCEQFADPNYLFKVGDRIVNLERAFNVREGFSRKEDRLPDRILHEPLQTFGAPGDGETVKELEQFLDRYYELRGWDEKGAPTARKLDDLGIAHIVK